MKSSGGSEARANGSWASPGPGKVRITIRLDREIVDWFRSQADARGGGNYQTMINNALRDYISQGGESLESILRRVIREELKSAGQETTADVIPRGRL
jgi:hypothetical protein